MLAFFYKVPAANEAVSGTHFSRFQKHLPYEYHASWVGRCPTGTPACPFFPVALCKLYHPGTGWNLLWWGLVGSWGRGFCKILPSSGAVPQPWRYGFMSMSLEVLLWIEKGGTIISLLFGGEESSILKIISKEHSPGFYISWK